MTNEQLASFIKQGGNDELIPILWGNVKKLLYIFADRYYRAYSDDLERYGVTAWDLKQQAYNAFLKAIEGYDESKGFKFTSYLNYPFKNAIRDLRTKDLLNKADSLNVVINGADDSGSTEVGDLLADESSLDFVTRIEDEEETEQIKRVVRGAVQKLPEEEREVIQEHFFNGRTYTDIATDKSRSVERISQRTRQAFARLRKNSEIKRLVRDLGYGSQKIYQNTLNGFMRNGISNVELIASRRADIEQRQKKREEEYTKLWAELWTDYNSGRISHDEFIEREKKLDGVIYGGAV